MEHSHSSGLQIQKMGLSLISELLKGRREGDGRGRLQEGILDPERSVMLLAAAVWDATEEAAAAITRVPCPANN